MVAGQSTAPMSLEATSATFYGLADYRLRDFGEIIEFYFSREEATAALCDIFDDEPGWEGELGVVEVDFAISPQ
jgi:hypothetical protein